MSYYDNLPPFLASRPVRLHFAGWETDTYRLQQNGWQLSAAADGLGQSRCERAMQIAFQHREYNIRGLSYNINVDQSMFYDTAYHSYPIEVGATLASDFISKSSTLMPFSAYKPIDAEPQFCVRTESMRSGMLFAPNLARTQEIIVPNYSVDDLMNMMLDRQAETKASIIRKRVNEQNMDFEPLDRPRVHAQLISVG